MKEIWSFSPSRQLVQRCRAQADLCGSRPEQRRHTVAMKDDFNFDGACGEAFFGAFIGQHDPPCWGPRPDPGWDFETRAGTVDVKATRSRTPSLMVGTDGGKRKLQADIFVLVQLVGERPDGKLVGWATKADVEAAPVFSHLKREPHVISSGRLRPISTLMEMIR